MTMSNSEARKRTVEREQQPTDREELRALAAEATPGPWFAEGSWSGFFHDGTGTLGTVYPDENAMDDQYAADAAYIAAASPDRVTALLDDLAAAKRERDESRKAARELREMNKQVRKQRNRATVRAERAEAQVAAVEAVAERWDAVLAECKESDPRWILDGGVMALDAALRELRTALDTPAATPTEPDADERGSISDGFGSEWDRCGLACDLQVVRPGKAQCNATSALCPNPRTTGADS